MATLDWNVRRRNGISLVELLVESDIGERVRIESRLSPIYPPRRQGRPAEGWDQTGFEGTVGQNGRLLLGFASPAEPVEPPAEIISQQPMVPEVADTVAIGPADQSKESNVTLSGEPAIGDKEHRHRARELVRELGTASPARDIVPLPAAPAGSEPGEPNPEQSESADGPGEEPSTERNSARRCQPDIDGRESSPTLDAIEGRIADAEALAAVSTVEQAEDAIDSVGGIERVRDLQAELATDKRTLECMATRQQSLARRLEDIEIPLRTLERIA